MAKRLVFTLTGLTNKHVEPVSSTTAYPSFQSIIINFHVKWLLAMLCVYLSCDILSALLLFKTAHNSSPGQNVSGWEAVDVLWRPLQKDRQPYIMPTDASAEAPYISIIHTVENVVCNVKHNLDNGVCNLPELIAPLSSAIQPMVMGYSSEKY